MARKRDVWTTTISPELFAKLKEFSEKTRVPMSKYVDEAVEDLLLKHKVIRPKTTTSKRPKTEKTEG